MEELKHFDEAVALGGHTEEHDSDFEVTPAS